MEAMKCFCIRLERRRTMKYQLSEQCYAIGKTIIKPDKQFSFLAYLITGKANILIDTLPDRTSSMLTDEIASVIGEKPLDAIILNHSEEDHSGALPMVLLQYLNVPVFCTESCKKRLMSALPEANFHAVKTGDVVAYGEYNFTFYETPGLHWDDNMVTFCSENNILFSNDLFGQYAAADPPVDRDYPVDALLKAAEHYYDKVFTSASKSEKEVVLKLADLPIRLIAPGHGLILENKFSAIMELYRDKIE
jgi:anaerobic nitric oxide reductase flavorubredoxin